MLHEKARPPIIHTASDQCVDMVSVSSPLLLVSPNERQFSRTSMKALYRFAKDVHRTGVR
jgi:hypothetical protein